MIACDHLPDILDIVAAKVVPWNMMLIPDKLAVRFLPEKWCCPPIGWIVMSDIMDTREYYCSIRWSKARYCLVELG